MLLATVRCPMIKNYNDFRFSVGRTWPDISCFIYDWWLNSLEESENVYLYDNQFDHPTGMPRDKYKAMVIVRPDLQFHFEFKGHMMDATIVRVVERHPKPTDFFMYQYRSTAKPMSLSVKHPCYDSELEDPHEKIKEEGTLRL